MKSDYHFDVAKLTSNLQANLLVQANAIAQRLGDQLEEAIKKDCDGGKLPNEHELWRSWRHVNVIRSLIMSGSQQEAVKEAEELFKEITN